MPWRAHLSWAAVCLVAALAAAVTAQQLLVGRIPADVQEAVDRTLGDFLGGLVAGDSERARLALGEALWVAYDSEDGVHETRMVAAEEFVGATLELQRRLRVEESWERQHKLMSEATLIPLGDHLVMARRWARWKEQGREMIRHDELVLHQTVVGWKVVGFISGAPVPLH
jgi:hypothetical protein